MIKKCHCGKEFKTYPSEIKKGKGKHCSRGCFYKFLKTIRGRKHSWWNGGPVKTKCLYCNKVFKVCKSKYEDKKRGKYCSRSCSGKANPIDHSKFKHKNGKDHHLWKGGEIEDQYGYILVYKKDHPFADCKGYIRKHRLLMERHIGRYVQPCEVVHHKNGAKDDNRFENLELMTDSEHKRLHAIERESWKVMRGYA